MSTLEALSCSVGWVFLCAGAFFMILRRAWRERAKREGYWVANGTDKPIKVSFAPDGVGGVRLSPGERVHSTDERLRR